MKYTGLVDLDNKPIHENDIVEIYSVGAKVGMAKVVFKNNRWEVEWFGEYTKGLVTGLKYLVSNKSIKVIEKPLYID